MNSFGKSSLWKQHSSEEKLLVLCSRTRLTPTQEAEIKRLLSGSVNWTDLLSLASRHLVTTLFYRCLQNHGLDSSIPQEIREVMHRLTMVNLAQNMRKRAELIRIVKALNEASIPVLVLKGNAIIHTIYQDESLRIFTDIDLLVPKEKLFFTKQIMTSFDYEMIHDNYPVPDHLNEELGCEWSYLNTDGIIAEIHWNLLDIQSRFEINVDDLFRRAVPFKLDDIEILSLSPEDELIHLCIHQYKHHWQRLRDLCDINELVIKYSNTMDWDAVLDLSHAAKADKSIYYTLTLAEDVLAAPVPAPVTGTLRDITTPGILSRSMFDMIEKNILAYEMPHGYWPVILVDGFSAKTDVINTTTTKQAKVASGLDEAGTERKTGRIGSRIRSLRSTINSLYGYRHLLIDLLRFLVSNTSARVFGTRRSH